MISDNFHFFWGKDDVFSQWHPSVFVEGPNTYNCCEQYMMAYKAVQFRDVEAWHKIMVEKDPSKHKALGRQVKNFNQHNWEQLCKGFVYTGNYLKFSQNPHMLKELLETKGELVEASPYDTIWGIGLSAHDPKAQNKSTWRGTNWLGEILTKLREDLR